MKKSLFTLVLCLIGGLLGADKKPNIILILSDDQGYGDMSCTGNPVLKTTNFRVLTSAFIVPAFSDPINASGFPEFELFMNK